jgi:hypothetical protein
MGQGKTQSAITKMNREIDKKFIFVTQRLTETDRIAEGCPDRKFAQPWKGRDGKLTNLHRLLKDKRNIANSHALFYQYTDETLQLIREGKYCLILDEVIDIVRFLEIGPRDIKTLIDSRLIEIEPETNRVIWLEKDYNEHWKSIKQEIETEYITFEDNHLMVWMLPIELFSSFNEVLILTYMFKAQYQYYYFKLYGIDVEYIGVRKCKGGTGYEFTPKPSVEKIKIPEIHIYEGDNLNAVGDDYYALSAGWHKNEDGKHTADKKILKDNLYNFYTHKCVSKSENRLWSTFDPENTKLGGKGYAKRCIAFNTRAVNDYSNCTHLAYLVNVFTNVNIMNYFERRGFSVDRDALATSDMVQWLWRSALRNGHEVWLYLPSSRMRNLLKEWIAKNGE